MKTIAQKRAKINGWIKEYEKRVGVYKLKYGGQSNISKFQAQRCGYKIKIWRNQLKEVTKQHLINKKIVAKFVYKKTCEYFGSDINLNAQMRWGSLGRKPQNYYISKFLVDYGLISDDSMIHIKSLKRSMYWRRDALTKSNEHKNSYRAYKLAMQVELEAAAIIYK